MDENQKKPLYERGIFYVILLIAFILLLIALGSFKIIDPGERGVVVRMGKIQDTVMEEGIHFKLPIADKIAVMDVQFKKYEVSEMSYSKDAQIVEAAALTFHHRNPDEKEFTLGQIKDNNWDKIIKELKKCDLVCFNCHMEIHEKLNNK